MTRNDCSTPHRLLSRLTWMAAAIVIGISAAFVQPASAAVTVDQTPLLTQLQLDPNLIFLLDDSGSMQFEFLGTQGLIDDNNIYAPSDTSSYSNLIYGFPLGSTYPYGSANYYDYVPGFESDNIYAAQFRSASINTNYYNPATTYTPWACAGSYPESSTDSASSYTATAYAGSSPACHWDSTVDLWVMPNADPTAAMLTPTQSGSWRDLETWNNSPIATNNTVDNGYIGNDNTGDPRWTTTPSVGSPTTPNFQYGAYQGTSAGTPGFWPATYFDYIGPRNADGTPNSSDIDDPNNYQRIQICPESSFTETVNLYNDSAGSLNGATATITACTQPSALPSSPLPYNTYVNSSGDYVYVEGNGTQVVRTYTQEVQNFANWYQYYRSHILTAKAAASQQFMSLSSSFRVDFALLNEMATSGGTPKYSTVQPFQGSERTNFLSDLLQTPIPPQGTPSRLALAGVGAWLSQAPTTSPPWGPSSAEATDEGSNNPPTCRQNYTVFATDGSWNGADPNVGNVDDTAGPQITGQNGQSYTYTPAPPYEDSWSNTLADVAMKYWMNDLQPGMANNVPSNTSDPAFWQHMDTFTIGLGVQGTLAYPGALSGLEAGTTQWPDPSLGISEKIDDLWHAAIDGHGAYLNAQDPSQFASALGQALTTINSRAGSSASLAANSTQLKTGTVAYQALYYTNKWTGDIDAYSINPNTGAIANTPTWSAAQQMPVWSSRNVWTYNPSGSTSSSQFVQFNQPSTLSTAEQDALGSTATSQQTMINFLLGDTSNEQQNGGTFRNRDTPLGDIVHSQPVYVGAPDPNTYYGMSFTGSSSYTTFADAESTREPLVWVAANDGMLHAFDANTGKETFAYLPAADICPSGPQLATCSSTDGVSELASPGYGSSIPHEYFNDGQLTVADVYLGSSTGWQTVLVGTTGRGPAEAIYALDITDPTNPTLLWERSAGDGKTNSNYIGQMVGQPVIAQTADGVWSVLIGNGYNSASGTAALLQFDVATGNLTVYPTNATTNNGLAAPAVWLDSPADGLSTTAYAGDLNGNVWSFDLTNPGSNGTLLFTATDSSGTPQPITAGMLAGENPQTGNRWLFFGTGRYLSHSDITDKSVQTWYGIIVKAGPSQSSTLVTNLVNGRSALKQRSIIAEQEPNPNGNPATLGIRVVSTPTTGDMQGESGWYIDLVSPTLGDQGERMVTPNQFQGSLLIGTTRIPESADICNPSGGGWVMAINPFTGTNPTALFFDANEDGQFNSADMLTVNGTPMPAAGLGFSSVPNNPIFVGNTMLMSFDNATTSSIQTAGTVGTISRVSWQELVNP